ncbi:MAG: hypothetical protein ABDH16_04855 [Thermodesulfovibrionaceae bacterium]
MKTLLILFISLFFLTVDWSFAEQQPFKPVKPEPPAEPKPGFPPLRGPSIKTDLKWEFVKYEDPYSREATYRVTATFKNIGAATARCPVAPCKAVLRTYEDKPNPKWAKVLASRDITTLAGGQSITLTADIKVLCSLEFPHIIEALHDVNFKHPEFYSYRDPDDIVRYKGYDDDLTDNKKTLKERDIMNAIWSGCTPKLK